mgnify:CR=1 FL=1
MDWDELRKQTSHISVYVADLENQICRRNTEYARSAVDKLLDELETLRGELE